jgi:hypothetical protein
VQQVTEASAANTNLNRQMHNQVQRLAKYALFALLAGALFRCQPSNTCAHGPTSYLLQLSPSPSAHSGPLRYTGQLPLPGIEFACTAKLDALENPNGFRIGLITQGHTSAECFSVPDATIVLTPNTKTTPSDMTKIFGESKPSFPFEVSACVEPGGSQPPMLAVKTYYTIQ